MSDFGHDKGNMATKNLEDGSQDEGELPFVDVQDEAPGGSSGCKNRHAQRLENLYCVLGSQYIMFQAKNQV